MRSYGLRSIVLCMVLIVSGICQADRTSTICNSKWKFTRGCPEGVTSVDFNDAHWQSVDLPHDWAIAGPFDPNGDPETGKLPWRGQGVYRKHFILDAEDKGRRVYFLFDGVMAFPKVYINGQLAGQWDYGYNSFWVDATDFVVFGQVNVMAVTVDTRQHESRWYPGAGIYRKVTMVITDHVHVRPWGIHVTTPEVTDDLARVKVEVTLENHEDQPQDRELLFVVLDPNNQIAAQGGGAVPVPGGQITLAGQFDLEQPVRWDVDDPRLYRAMVFLRKGQEVLDQENVQFGIRTFQFTADDGFHLNGRRVQLKGVNLHHDQGPLGAAAYLRALQRQLEILKDMGCNAIRTSHNVPSPELLHLCDYMGFLVFAETFDKWDATADRLEDVALVPYAQRQIQNFCMRDRNHPSIVCWSIGNEIRKVLEGEYEDSSGTVKAMVDTFKSLDPDRPVTMGCDRLAGLDGDILDALDIQSWNYARKYAKARERDPNKPTLYSESASALSTRGHYELTHPEKKDQFSKSLQVDSYDWHAASWADIPDVDFYRMETDRYCAGEFVWTGFDYLGEPTPYNNKMVEAGAITRSQAARSSYFGMVDLCGMPKDRYYLYRSHWLPNRTTVHIVPHWTWPGHEGQKIPVYVYTNGDEAELFVNNKSFGRRTKRLDGSADPNLPAYYRVMDRYRLRWEDVIYEPGNLRVEVYRDGQKIQQQMVSTAGPVKELYLTPHSNELIADGEDLCFIQVEGFDEYGTLCPHADNLVTFKVSGPATIAGVGNGNPQSLESFASGQRHLFHGKAMLIIRTEKDQPGIITIRALCRGLKSGYLEITSQTF